MSLESNDKLEAYPTLNQQRSRARRFRNAGPFCIVDCRESRFQTNQRLVLDESSATHHPDSNSFRGFTLSHSTDQPPPPAAQVSGTTVDSGTPAKAEPNVVLGFRPRDRRIMTVLMSILLLWLVCEWILVATRRPDPLLLQRGSEFHANFRVNVNDSIWVDWTQLEGIGPSLAQRIVVYRNLHGRFSSIEDVARVPGIGPTTLDRIRPWLTIGHDENETRSARANGQRPSTGQPATNQRQPTAL